MMIANAKMYIKEHPNSDTSIDTVSIWQISEVLAICTGKLKEDIVSEIIDIKK